MSQLKIGALVVTVGILAHLASAQSFTFTKIADTSTTVPNSGGTYTSFGIPTADREYTIAAGLNANFFYSAQSSNGVSGVYFNTTVIYYPIGTLTYTATLADTTMAAATGGTFTSFSSLTSGWGAVGFIGQSSNGAEGVYEADAGWPDYNYDTLRLITQTGDSPSSGVTFQSIENVSIMGFGQDGFGDEVRGEMLTDAGIYDIDLTTDPTYTNYLQPSYTFIANASTIPPGASGPFTAFGPISYKAPRYANSPGPATEISAFLATAGGVQGIYYNDVRGAGLPHPPNLQLLVSTATPSIVQFTSFGNPVASSDQIIFTAHYNSGGTDIQGIFDYGQYFYGAQSQTDVPKLTELLAGGAVAPGSDRATFSNFSSVALFANGSGAFLASLSDGREALYYFNNFQGNLSLDDILDTGQMLDGKSIADIQMSSEGLGANDGAFKVDFTDGSEGLYYFTINFPEPASLGLMGLPILFMLRRR